MCWPITKVSRNANILVKFTRVARPGELDNSTRRIMRAIFPADSHRIFSILYYVANALIETMRIAIPNGPSQPCCRRCSHRVVLQKEKPRKGIATPPIAARKRRKRGSCKKKSPVRGLQPPRCDVAAHRPPGLLAKRKAP